MNDKSSPFSSSPMAPYMELTVLGRPTLSADSAQLAYLSDASGMPQIWSRPWAGGAARQLTRMEEPVTTLAASPVGQDLLFTTDCGGDERHQLWLLRAGDDTPQALTSDPTSVHAWGCWAPDGQRIAYSANIRDKTCMDVYVMDLATGQATCVRQGSGYQDVLAFYPDGAALLLRDWAGGPHDQHLLRLDLQDGAATPLLPHAGRAEYSAVRMRRDGSGFYVLSDQDNDHFRIGSADAEGSSVQWLVAVENRSIEAMAASPDPARIAYVVNQRGWHEVRVRDLASGADDAITGLPAGVARSLAWAPGSDTLLFPYEGPATPPAIWRADAKTLAAQPAETAGAPPADVADFVLPAAFEVASFDGLALPCFLYRPTVAAPPAGYPVVVIVHGGPAMAWDANFRADVQCLVARGMMVVAPNVRGSSGYGRRYHELDDTYQRLDSVADLQAVRLWVGRQADVDDSRVAVFGRSYGGYMVLAALTTYPESWRAGVDFYGIANFHTLLATTGPWRSKLRAAEYGSPEADADLLTRISPIHAMHKLAAPLMIVHGMDDPRVPPGESEMLHSVVRGLGKPVQYLRIPHAGHGFLRRDQRHIVFTALEHFLQGHL